ncbi:MAG: glycosyltransferase, partial [Chloroflexaceae bacterium]|nr:glycosyltransferase [Chloroflexaceae bacterium]
MSRLFYQPERHAGQRSATTLPPVRHTTLVRRLLVPTLAVGLVLVAIAWLVVMQPGLWATVAVLLVGLALAMRQGVVRREASVMVLTVAVGVSTVNYMAWRAGLINWGSWWVAVPLFLAEVLGALHALGLQYTVWPRKEPLLNPTSDPTRLPVYIFIPTVNEGVAVLEPTIRGALAARERYLTAHPHARVEIVICNDGRVANAANWQETERLAERLGVTCITRTVGGGAKAGNIEHARQQVGATGAALLVIFDADQVAEPEFLLKTVPPFA